MKAAKLKKVIKSEKNSTLTRDVLIGMLAGAIIGLLINQLPRSEFVTTYIVEGVFMVIGTIFITLMKMLVVPIVFVSLVSGVTSLGDLGKLGRVGGKTILLYLLTTCIAITLALTFAFIFRIGSGTNLMPPSDFLVKTAPSIKATLLNLFPSNPVSAMAKSEMLQIIVFSLLLGTAISLAKKSGKRIADMFNDFNQVLMKFIGMLMQLAPYGVFCLISMQFAKAGFDLILQLLGYFLVVLFVLILHLIITNSTLLLLFARLNPWPFFKKMFSAMIFGFSTSSSSVSIPVTLSAVETKLGVGNAVAAFVVPLGATINMDGTAIMQGVATVFIAHVYNIHISLTGYLTVIATATLASIGTAGVPSVGLITLAMVLQQVGLPVEGISLIIGVDRLLDMVRTAVNITGDAAVSCVVGKSEKVLDEDVFTAAT